MNRPLSVFVTSCETGAGARRGSLRRIRELYDSSNRAYALSDDPETADLILVTDLAENKTPHFAAVLNNPVISRYPDKSFCISMFDLPLVLNRGIYDNAVRSLWSLGRARSGSYASAPSQMMNPFVSEYAARTGEDHRERRYLFSFIGRNSHAVRSRILSSTFQRPDILIQDSSDYDQFVSPLELEQNQLQRRLERQRAYCDILWHSKFSLCPRGLGASSIRLFESMQLGIAPIIIADRWLPPTGPKWSECSILVREKHVRHLEMIASSYEAHYLEIGTEAKTAYARHFEDSKYFNYIVDNCLDMMHRQVLPERLYWKCRHVVAYSQRLKDRMRVRHNVGRLLAVFRR
jgi:hypothetical protein